MCKLHISFLGMSILCNQTNIDKIFEGIFKNMHMLDLCLIKFWLKLCFYWLHEIIISYCMCKYKCIGYKFLQLNNRLRYNMSIGQTTDNTKRLLFS